MSTAATATRTPTTPQPPKIPPKRPAHPISFAPGAGIPAAKVRGTAHCPGCRDHPLPECACCGADAIVAIVEPGDLHAITYCRACLRVLLAARAECNGEKQINAARIAARRDSETGSSASPAPSSPKSSPASASPLTRTQTRTQNTITHPAGRADLVQPTLPLCAALEVA